MLRVRLNTAGGNVPMVQNYASLFAGVRRYIGLRYDASLGENGGWAATGMTVELPADQYQGEYIRHLRTGDLVAVDEATAKKAGLKWIAPEPEAPVVPGS